MKANKTGLQIAGFLAVLGLMPVTSFANDACKETNPDKFFELINAAVQAIFRRWIEMAFRSCLKMICLCRNHSTILLNIANMNCLYLYGTVCCGHRK